MYIPLLSTHSSKVYIVSHMGQITQYMYFVYVVWTTLIMFEVIKGICIKFFGDLVKNVYNPHSSFVSDGM